MKKIILILMLLVNLVPHVEKGKLKLFVVTKISAQELYSDEDEEVSDPCDPNSYAYDTDQCDRDNCDPNSFNYEPAYCEASKQDPDSPNWNGMTGQTFPEVTITGTRTGGAVTSIVVINVEYSYSSSTSTSTSTGGGSTGGTTGGGGAKGKILIQDCGQTSRDHGSKADWRRANFDTDKFTELYFNVTNMQGVYEKSTLLDYNSETNNFTTSDIVNGGPTSVGCAPGTITEWNSSGLPYYDAPIAEVHTHPVSTNPNTFNYAPPSAGDLYAIAGTNKSDSYFTDLYVIAYDKSEYDLQVVDPAALATFQTNYPEATYKNADGGFNETTAIGQDFKKAYDAYIKQGFSKNDAFAFSEALILSSYDTGVRLFKRGSDGKFHQQNGDAMKTNGKDMFYASICM